LLLTLKLLTDNLRRANAPDWIAFTPEGYYAASPGAGGFIRWRVGDTLHAAKLYESKFHRPDLVQKALQRRD